MSGTLAFFRVVLLEHYGATLNRLAIPGIPMYILEHVRIHPLDSFPGRCQDTNRNGPPFTSHAMVRSPDPPMVRSQEPLEVTQWMSRECRVLVLGSTSLSLKDFDLNMAAKPVKYGQKWIYILISMESFNLNTLSLRFGDTKWEKSIEHQFFWPHLTALNVVSICSLCTSRIYTASVEGVGWCCGQSLAKKRCKCSAKLLRRDVELFPYYIITTCS